MTVGPMDDRIGGSLARRVNTLIPAELSMHDRRVLAEGMRRMQSKLVRTRDQASATEGFLVSAFTDQEASNVLDEPETVLFWCGPHHDPDAMLLLTDVAHFVSLDPARVRPWIAGDERYVYQLAVDHVLAGRGLGTALVREAQSLRRPLLTDVVVSPVRNERSLRLFERCSFTPLEEIPLESFRAFGPICSLALRWTP